MTPDEQAVERLSHFVRMWDEKPLRGVDDEVYAIHTGTKWEGSLRISDLRAAIAALAHPVSGDVEGLLEKHIQRCRDAIAKCPKWSAPQAEWSRARDALLNFRDDLEALARGEGM